MRSRSVSKFLLLFLVSLLSACGQAQNSDEDDLRYAQSLMNDRQYTEAIDFISGSLARHPNNQELELLLADAHLGRAGIEILPMLKAAMSPQPEVQSEITPVLRALGAAPCTSAEVGDLASLNLTCVTERILRLAPATDHPDVLRAQAIFRRRFSDASSAPEGANFVAGFTEFISALARTRAVLSPGFIARMEAGLWTDSNLFPFDEVIHQSKAWELDLNWTLRRFSASYSKFRALVSGLNGTLIYADGTRQLVFDSQVSVADILRFLADILRNRSLPLDATLSELLTSRMNSSTYGLLEWVAATDLRQSVPRSSPQPLSTGLTSSVPAVELSFGNYLSTVLNGAAELEAERDLLALPSALPGIAGLSSRYSVVTSFFTLLWSNPPPLVLELQAAAQLAWDLDSGAPLREYFSRTQSEWRELWSLVQEWNRWYESDLSAGEQQGLLLQLRAASIQDPQRLGFPREFTPEGLAHWSTNVISFLDYTLQNSVVLVAQTDSAYSRSRSLMERTRDWSNRNFYPVQDWVRVTGTNPSE